MPVNLPQKAKRISWRLDKLVRNIYVKITIIFDNYPHNAELKTEWGFSCLIEGFENALLFDTGGDGKILLDNMKNLGIDPNKIDKLLISHDHWDHTGGLQSFLEKKSDIDVYMLPSFSNGIKDIVRSKGAHLVESHTAEKLCSHIHTSGTLGKTIKEQSIIIETQKGLVIITGCAHPGIIHIIENAQKCFNQRINMVFGGFHLGSYTDSVLKNIIAQFRRLKVENAGPCHFSGDRCRKLFVNEYKNNFLNIGVG